VAELLQSRTSARSNGLAINRQLLIELPKPLAQELIAEALHRSGLTNLNAALIKRAWLFGKTSRVGTRRPLGGNVELKIDNGNVLVVTKTFI